MGVGLNTMLAAVGAGGVAASKVGTAVGEMISEANDGNKNLSMAQKARKNRDANIKAKKMQRDVLKRREKVVKGVISGVNQDPKTRVNVMQEMRER